MVRIELDLSKHCIQAATKKAYKRLLAECLAAEKADKLREEALELLKVALETFDFPRLRAQYPALAGHHPDAIAIAEDDDRRVVITVGETVIDPVVSSGECS